MVFEANTSCRPSSVSSSIAPRYMLAAPCTTASRPPPCSTAAATIAARSAAVVTSPTTPHAPAASATAPTFSARRPDSVTRAPARFSGSPPASPMPEPPPVTSTDIPSIARPTSASGGPADRPADDLAVLGHLVRGRVVAERVVDDPPAAVLAGPQQRVPWRVRARGGGAEQGLDVGLPGKVGVDLVDQAEPVEPGDERVLGDHRHLDPRSERRVPRRAPHPGAAERLAPPGPVV